MGACQDQFESVPELITDISPEYERQQNRFSTNSINLEHKAARANTQNVTIGLIDTKLQSYRSQQILNSQFNQFGAASIDFSPNRSTNLSRNHSVTRPILQGQQFDRQQLHATQRPFLQMETINLGPQQKLMRGNKHKARQALDLTFYHSLGLPEYVYEPIQPGSIAEYQNLIICQQQQRNGVKYIGEWKNDRRTVHGNGIMQSNTTKYIGQFKNGLKHFHGRQIQKQEVYQGKFVDGRRKGKGKRYTLESEEDGNFDQNLISGKIIYSNKNQYHGKLQNNYYHDDHGCFIDGTNNLKYVGQFKNGKLNGKGQIFLMSNGKIIYDGEFKQGLKHGGGKFIWSQQEYYEGCYSRGKKHGKGKLYKKDVCYQGYFLNGKMNGNFKMNRRIAGTWKFEKDLQFNNGAIIAQEQSSIYSDNGLPSEWRQAIQRKEEILITEDSNINQPSLSNIPSRPIQVVPQLPQSNICEQAGQLPSPQLSPATFPNNNINLNINVPPVNNNVNIPNTSTVNFPPINNNNLPSNTNLDVSPNNMTNIPLNNINIPPENIFRPPSSNNPTNNSPDNNFNFPLSIPHDSNNLPVININPSPVRNSNILQQDMMSSVINPYRNSQQFAPGTGIIMPQNINQLQQKPIPQVTLNNQSQTKFKPAHDKQLQLI